ncbi:MAG: FAD-dependent oxidoreductase, partial [Deltaproteobacteria bacterium]|nr:FAD-dependent oxidoreductase [Deltaproteobacteria bacterium]
MATDFDIIIIGQGLAGSLLAHALEKKGENILVLDDDHQTASSSIAAGMINPITGHRPNKDPLFDLYLEQALQTYQELENDFGQRFIQPQKQIRIFNNKAQRHQWLTQATPNNDILEVKPEGFPHLHLPHGGCLVAFSYIVNVPLIIKTIADHLSKKHRRQITNVTYD